MEILDSIIPLNFKSVNDYITKIKYEILSGNKDPLIIKRQLKIIREIVTQVEKDKEVNDYFLSEAEKYGKTFEHVGCKFQISERTRYNYSFCNDSKLKYLEAQTKLADNNLKARQEWLKSLKESFVDEDTGEIIYPAAKKSTTTISVTLLEQ